MVVAVMAAVMAAAADDVIVCLMFLDGCLKSYFDGGGRRRLNSAHPRWWRLGDLRPWMTLRLDGLDDPGLG